MEQTAAQMAAAIQAAKQRRAAGEIGPKEYYAELLEVLKNLADSLLGELDKIEDADVRSQIPLLLVILDEQVRAFGERE